MATGKNWDLIEALFDELVALPPADRAKRLARVDVHDDLQEGRLVQVLPQWAPPPLDVWAVTPQRDAQPAKVRHAIDALQRYLLLQPGVLP